MAELVTLKLCLVRTARREAPPAHLHEHGTRAGLYYPPALHRQPAYAHLHLGPGSLPVAEEVCASRFSLPMFRARHTLRPRLRQAARARAPGLPRRPAAPAGRAHRHRRERPRAHPRLRPGRPRGAGRGSRLHRPQLACGADGGLWAVRSAVRSAALVRIQDGRRQVVMRRLREPQVIALAPDGGVYLAETRADRVLHSKPR